jgi:nucleotide-binding universal stress UspA family protein
VHAVPEGGLSEEQMELAVRNFVAKIASDVGETAPAGTVNVVTGNVAEELVRASCDADMLVVGSRGNGGFARLVRGSVSSQVMHHAKCPVVIIPKTR